MAIVISQADATVTVNGYTGVYDAAAHGATGSATGIGGVVLTGLSLGDSFTNVPGGTANWTFTNANYADESGSVAIDISKADATVTVSGYTGVYDAAAHGASGSATGIGGVVLTGLSLGDSFTNVPGGTANWTFTNANYTDESGSVAIDISKADPTINWSNPADIVYGTALNGAQLNATATGVSGALVGTFTYDPAAGTKLNAGSGQTLSVDFTPTDTTNYNDASKDVKINVLYAFGGILPPINPDGSSIFKLGSTVPVKFQLRDAAGNFVTSAVAKIYLQKISNGVTGTELEAVSTAAATSGNLFRLADSQYIFNLATKPLTAGTWQIRILLDDGTNQYVQISLKK